jgi:hypothetical protein
MTPYPNNNSSVLSKEIEFCFHAALLVEKEVTPLVAILLYLLLQTILLLFQILRKVLPRLPLLLVHPEQLHLLLLLNVETGKVKIPSLEVGEVLFFQVLC